MVTPKEEETVRDTLSKITGAKFEVLQTPSDYHFPVKNIQWFIRCRVLDDIRKTPYLNASWRETGGPIWLESLVIGDTINWIETAEGEEAAGKSLDIDYSEFDSQKFQAEFGRNHPLVFKQIQRNEAVVERLAKSFKVNLEFRKSGSKGIAVFSFAAKIPDFDSKTLEEKLRTNVEALKEAYQQAKSQSTI